MIKQRRALRGALALAVAAGVALSALTGTGTSRADSPSSAAPTRLSCTGSSTG
ncbi:hypothetical protein ACFQY7_36115 [Actinomadura luteofluorescens]|uniref:hypothetical protein n=1 Tax=Actinomadura luteofluorescens TaxID=46163 RepID=UPI003642C4AE